jgi:hypothetical protein
MPRYPAPKIPPSCENIPIELAMRVLAESGGNVSKAADVLGVPSRDFRYWVRNTSSLTAVVDEVMEIFCDRAEAILREALESEHEVRRDAASRFVLNGKGAPRGWSRDSQTSVAVDRPLQHIVIKWLGDDDIAPSKVSGGGSALIDARPVKVDEPSAE